MLIIKFCVSGKKTFLNYKFSLKKESWFNVIKATTLGILPISCSVLGALTHGRHLVHLWSKSIVLLRSSSLPFWHALRFCSSGQQSIPLHKHTTTTSTLLNLHVHCAVSFRGLSLKVSIIALPWLILHCFGSSLEGLHDGLCFARVSGTCLLWALDEDVLLDQVSISLLSQLFTLARYLKLLRDDSEVLRSIHGCVGDLGLEGQVSHSSHIEIFHLE